MHAHLVVDLPAFRSTETTPGVSSHLPAIAKPLAARTAVMAHTSHPQNLPVLCSLP
jgi:hypothetical protein